ncbi:MAG: hypothetical protein Q9M43_13425 [Sulfurimonas sp.]|nr:hypothetical protein [Sulfurimonas sp.]
MILLLAKIGNSLPFCSNSYHEYENDENLVLGNCKVKDTGIDILENFLACAVYLNAPVVTAKTLCNNKFLDKKIEIICKDEIVFLDNYFLEDTNDIIKKVKENIKLSASNWEDWKTNSLPLYKNILITNDCFKEILNYSFSSKYAHGILDFIEKVNTFIANKKINTLNFDECCSHTTKESETRRKQFKNQLMVKNCDDTKEIASWHTRINQDFRLYFTLDAKANKTCFVKLTKKIS